MVVSRVRVAVAIAGVLLLGGCAVPGKGEPGVVATYRGHVITDDDITALHNAMDELFSAPNVGEDLTLLLIGSEVVAIAEDVGYDLSEEHVEDRAQAWVSYATWGQGGQVTLSSAAFEVVKVVEALNLVVHDADGTLALVALVQDIEDNGVFSPRYGDFTLDNFSESVGAISDFITTYETELSIAEFTAWRNINGFSVTRPDWVSSE